MGLPQYNRPEVTTQRVYYSGTETLVAGAPLCFEPSPNTTAYSKGFPFDVQSPVTANRTVFAGLVADGSAGVTGPAYIDLIIPRSGEVHKVQVSRAADVAVGAILKLNADLDTTASQGLAGFDALADSTVATSVAESVVVALLKESPALVQVLESVASTATNNTRTAAWVKFL